MSREYGVESEELGVVEEILADFFYSKMSSIVVTILPGI